MDDSFLFRKYSDDDFEDYKNLYKSVYCKNIDKNFFRWKHSMNMSINQNPIIYLVVNGEKKIIGASSFFVTKLVYNGNKYDVVQLGDTMVSKEYRGKGLFKKSIGFALEDLKNSGYNGIFAFANSNSYPGLLKLGFDSLYKINLYVKVLNYEAMLRGKLGDKPGLNIIGKVLNFYTKLPKYSGDKFNIEEADLLQSNILSFINEANKNYIHLDKNRDYIKWKYLDKPECRYETVLIKNEKSIYAVFVIRIDNICGRKSGKIVEYFSKENKETSTYFNLISNYYTNKGLDYIEMWDVGNEHLKRILKKNKFIKRKVKLYFIIKAFNEKLESINDLSLWRICGGDADTA
ncbi:GNAT family N-acetyltransferase [Clostridium sp. BJN0013]|uniref:GNAT family N-acetyltransferase n=1 Tax=Clostridium sp. BJN0013 TaxID=3236840 RepID=UPI0034C5F0D3